MIFQLSKKVLILGFLAFLASSTLAANGYGSLIITSESGSIPVSLDMVDVGATPVSLPKVQAGRHLVTANSADQQIFSQMIEVKVSEEAVLWVSIAKNQEIEPSQEAIVEEIARPNALQSSPGWGWQLGYSAISYHDENTYYNYGSNSGVQVGFSHDYQLFSLKSRVSVGYLFGTRCGVLPVTNDLIFSLDDGRYFGFGVGAVFSSMSGGMATGWRTLAGFGPANNDEPWQFEIVDDYYKSQTTSFFSIAVNFRYRLKNI